MCKTNPLNIVGILAFLIALVKKQNGNLISSIHDAKLNEEVVLEMHDGKITTLTNRIDHETKQKLIIKC